MKNKNILTTILVIALLSIFLIKSTNNNFFKMNSKYKLQSFSLEQDPLKTKIYTLENGLKVFLTEYKNAPRLQTSIAVRAGSKHDPSDATGLAHYLEHMLFKGTDKYGTINFTEEKPLLDKIEDLYEEYRKVPMSNVSEREKIWNKIDSLSNEAAKFAIANEYDKMVSGIGAKGTNAYTSNEKTVYINDIPSNQIEKWLKLESERFRNPIFRLFHTELETVYEEKNRGLDDDGRKLFYEMLDAVFPNHQYGQQTTIGTIKHLKNPSLKEIQKYYDKYYVPNNMAICISGDFESESMIELIDKYFGGFESKEVPNFEVIKEKPIEKIIERSVVGPQAERLYIAFRFPGASSKDIHKLRMADMIMSNRTAGLIDLNLNQSQKIIGGGSFPFILEDYSTHVFYGSPKQNQNLNEVRDLLVSQIEELKNGNFPDWLMKAIISDLKLEQIKKYENNQGRANEYVEAFTLGIEWSEYIQMIDEMSKLNKQDIIDFANQYYKDNYAVVYKEQGEDIVEKVTKPNITPVSVNRESKTDFLNSLLSEEVNEIEPVFIDFENDINYGKIDEVPLHYMKNFENQRFELTYVFEAGTNVNPVNKIAFEYLQFLGTDSITSKQKQEILYKLGSEMSFNCSDDQVKINISGLDENFEETVKFLESFLSNFKSDEEALQKLKEDILKKRSDAKLNKQTILFNAMVNFAKYGENSPFTNKLTNEFINNIQSIDLVNIVRDVNASKHIVKYYGPRDISDVEKQLLILHKNKSNLNDIVDAKMFTEIERKTPTVYFLDYDMKQAEVIVISKNEKLNATLIPISRLHNEYFGGGMSSVMFQELRESQALAYSVYSTFTTPRKINDSHFQLSYIGTQADKLEEAMMGMMNLLKEMPKSEGNLNAAKEGIVQKIRTERITKSAIMNYIERAKKMGLSSDSRKNIFENIENFSMDDVENFHNEKISNQNYTYLVLADKKSINFELLSKYGKVEFLTLEKVFGY